MTTEEVLSEIEATKARLTQLRAELRFHRYLGRLRADDTVVARVYRVLESRPPGSLESVAMSPANIRDAITESAFVAPQYFAVEAALRSLRSTGAVMKLGWGKYAAASQLERPEPIRAMAATVV